MLIIYHKITRAIPVAVLGNHTISQFPEFDNVDHGCFSLADDPTIATQSYAYYVDSNLIPQLKRSLELTASPTTITNDGREKSTVTVKFKDGFGRLAYFNWVQKVSGTSLEIRDICFPSDSVGYAVGGSGLVLKTTDGGETWVPLTTGITSTLYSCFFVSTTIGYAVGNGGVIIKTTDGSTWSPLISGTTQGLRDVHFYSSTVGWAVGFNGTILATTDGTSWTPQTSGTVVALLGVSFGDNNNGYAVGQSGTILNTVDGGATWNPQVSGTTETLSDITLTTPSNQYEVGWVCGNAGTILKTTNAGTDWIVMTSGTVQSLQAISFSDLLNGWTVGDGGDICYTKDGGITWVTQFTILSPIFGVYAFIGTNGYTAVTCDVNGGIFKTLKLEAEVLINGPELLSKTVLVTEEGEGTFECATLTGSVVINVSCNRLYNPTTTTYVNDATVIGTSLALTITPVVDKGQNLLTPRDSMVIDSTSHSIDPTNQLSLAPLTDVYAIGTYQNYIYVGDWANQKIHEIDTTTNTFTGKEYDCSPQIPGMIGVDPTGTYLISVDSVASPASTKFDRVSTTKISTLAEGYGAVEFSADGSKYYLVDYNNDKITVVRMSDDYVLKTITDATNLTQPWRCVRRGNYLYLPRYAGDYLMIVDLSSEAVLPKVALTPYYSGESIATDGTSVYLSVSDLSDTKVGIMTVDKDNALGPFIQTGTDTSGPSVNIATKNGKVIYAYGNKTYLCSIDGKSVWVRAYDGGNPQLLATVSTSDDIYWVTNGFYLEWVNSGIFAIKSSFLGGGSPLTITDTINATKITSYFKNLDIGDADVNINIDSNNLIVTADSVGLYGTSAMTISSASLSLEGGHGTSIVFDYLGASNILLNPSSGVGAVMVNGPILPMAVGSPLYSIGSATLPFVDETLIGTLTFKPGYVYPIGIVMSSPSGQKWRMSVDDAGATVWTPEP